MRVKIVIVKEHQQWQAIIYVLHAACIVYNFLSFIGRFLKIRYNSIRKNQSLKIFHQFCLDMWLSN